jgi:hypothetical protein
MTDQQVHNNSADSAIQWVLSNKLKAIGYTWLGGVGGSLVRRFSDYIFVADWGIYLAF